MAAEGGTRAVVTALGANLGVAVAKFVAAAITGSTSMLAEGVHSVADSGNQVLLLIGGRRSRQAPSALHPFGYARALGAADTRGFDWIELIIQIVLAAGGVILAANVYGRRGIPR